MDALRSLRVRQILGRARRLVPVAVMAAGTSSRRPTTVRRVAKGVGVDPAPQSGPTTPPDESGVFSAVGASRRFGDAHFWDDPGDGLLFLFSLHGFSPLAAYAVGERTPAGDAFWADVVENWLSCAGRPRMPAWHPHPTSIRLISWCAALSTIAEWPGALRDQMAESILRQARYLRRAVEHDIGGNHVLKNGCALAIAGATVPSSGVFEVGLRLLRRELPRQILSDGGHEERTTSYHRAVLSDLRDVTTVLRQSGESVPHWLSEPLERATHWQQLVAAPDGTLPLLNDAWEGPAIPRPATEPITELPSSGYVVFRHDRDYALFDIGPISPPHLPAHAHADVLSFILWADGRPLLIDPGSWSYTGQGRQLFRGTAKHNTVQIDEKDQCEFWGDFRAAFHPRVRATSVTRQGEVAIVAGRHDGYRRLPDSVMHERTLVWWPGSGVVVVDILRARKTHKIGSRLHVAPGVVPDQADRLAGFRISALGDGAQSVAAKGAYSAHIGVRVPTTILEDRREVRPDTPFGWSVLRGGARVESIDPQLLRLTETGGRILEIPLSWT